MKNEKFKKRYVLGEGYPWIFGGSQSYKEVGLCKEPKATNFINLWWPPTLFDWDLPKYRLVLERIDNEKNRAKRKLP